MDRYFVPFIGDSPAVVDINGHKLLVVSRDKLDVESCLSLFGADSVESVEGEGPQDECHEKLEKLADAIKGDVVIAPEDSPLEDILSDLQEELPWLQ